MALVLLKSFCERFDSIWIRIAGRQKRVEILCWACSGREKRGEAGPLDR